MSEQHNIDELFRSVLDKPLENADPSAGWEAFENVHAAGNGSSVHKTAWLSAVASFAVFLIISLFNSSENGLSVQNTEKNIASLPSIVSFSANESEVEGNISADDHETAEFAEQVSELVRSTNTSSLADDIATSSKEQEASIAEEGAVGDIRNESLRDISLMAMNGQEEDLYQETFLSLQEKDFEEEKLKLKLTQEKNQLKIIASANTFNSVIGPSNPGTANSMQSIGLEYQRNVNEKLSFTLGLLYSHVGVSGFANSYDSIAYSFGTTTHRTEIAPIFTQNLNLPIGISYRPAYRHEVNLSAELGYLLDVHSVKTESVLGHESESPVIKENERGYQQGFNPLSTRLMLSYRYQITQGLQLGMSGRYAMTDMLDENYFDRKRKISPFFWQLELRYNLAKY